MPSDRQLSLFNGDQFNVAPTHVEEPEDPALRAAASYIKTGSTGAQGVIDRQGRRYANLMRLSENVEHTSATTHARYEGEMHGGQVPIERLGLRAHEGFWDEQATWLPKAQRGEHEWRKFGTVEEVPYTRIIAGQNYAIPERVDELISHLGTGVDPRYAGSMRELPHAVRVETATTPAYISHQGHHRVLSDMWKDQPEMFHSMRTTPLPTSRGEIATRAQELWDYRRTRSTRVQQAKQRAALKYPDKQPGREEARAAAEAASGSYEDSDEYQRGPAVLRDSDQFGT